MENRELLIGERIKIALVAYDNKKRDLFEWSKFNSASLLRWKESHRQLWDVREPE
jgi:hypothetical protein